MYEAEIAATLAWCNERRKEQGEPPLTDLPKGRKNDSLSCPCGEATGLDVLTFTYKSKGRTVVLPDLVTGFVVEFDAGNIPQYDSNPDE